MGACFSAYDEYEADANRGNALAAMLKVEGFDVIIICCGTPIKRPSGRLDWKGAAASSYRETRRYCASMRIGRAVPGMV